MIKIKNVYYGVKDMKKTRNFYSEVLGLKLQFNDRNQWVQFKVNDVTFALGGNEEIPPELTSGAVVTFEVEDLQQMINKLHENGIEVSEIRDMGSHGITCYFKDPANNIVQLYQKQ